MILDKHLPWKDTLLNSSNPKVNDILYCISPSNRGGYNINTIPVKDEMFKNKKDLPKEWAGLRDSELQMVSGVNTIRFCHNNLFIAATENLEDAIKVAKIAIEYVGEKE